MILKTVRVHTNIRELTNCYIVEDEETKEIMVIDPGGEADKIIEALNKLNGNLKYIYLTHCHGDHISAINAIKDIKGGKVIIHRFDAEGLNNRDVNLSPIVNMKNIELAPDSRLNDGDLIHVGNIEFKVIHTPGHTIGGSSLYCPEENIIFTGDTLFKCFCGRTDLPTSSFDDIIDSITNRLLLLPDDTIVYPGHGVSTTIGEERPVYIGNNIKKN